MASVWSAIVPRQPSIPFDEVHVALYSYFPRGAAVRPYVWRLLDADRIGLVSAQRITAPSARELRIEVGVKLAFRLTHKRTRNVGGSTTREDGTRRKRQQSTVTINSMPEMRERLIRFAAERGGAIGYVRLERLREVVLVSGGRRIRLPIVDAEGQVLVTDAERFALLLAQGGPGTGKAYGAGAWWLPELMEAA